MSDNLAKLVDEQAAMYLRALAAKEDADGAVTRYRAGLIDLVQKHGQHPPRATKTLALAGVEYELRVTTPQETTVDTRGALRIENACRAQSSNWRSLFARLFRRVETFVVVDGAHELMNRPKLPVRAPRNLRSLFARAVRIEDKAPKLDVEKIEKKPATAGRGKEAA